MNCSRSNISSSEFPSPHGLPLKRGTNLSILLVGRGVVRHSKPNRPMSGLGQKRTFTNLRPMSALPPKADMDQSGCDVRYVSKADIAPLIRSPGRRVQEHWLEFVGQV